jgi:hypothetical protein
VSGRTTMSGPRRARVWPWACAWALAWCFGGGAGEALAQAGAVEGGVEAVEAARALLLAPAPPTESGATSRALTLAADPRPEVAAQAILALARARGPWVGAALAELLADPAPHRREYAAIALLLRDALAEVPPVERPDSAVIERARTQITTEVGRAWVEGVEVLAAWRAARDRWLASRDALGALEADPALAPCAEGVGRLPVLLDPLVLGSEETVGAYLEGAPAVGARPPTALAVGPGPNALTLAVVGDFAALADWTFALEADAAQTESWVARVSAHCGDSAVVPGGGQPTWEAPGTAAEHTSELRLALTLGVDSQPFAFRAGDLSDFVVGDSLELSVAPELRYTWQRYAAGGDPRLDRGRVGPGGAAVDVRAGGFLSSRFVQDRSRPTAHLGVQVDGAEGQGGGGLRFAGELTLAAAVEPSYRDLSLLPAPYLRAELGGSWVEHDDASAPSRPAREVGLRLTGLVHVLDDARSPVRDRAWVEPTLFYVQRFGERGAPLRLGVDADLRVRSADGERAAPYRAEATALGEPAAGAANARLLLSWRRGALLLEGRAGVGAGALFGVDARAAATYRLEPVGGLELAAHSGGADLAFVVGLAATREVTTVGRLGELAIVDRAEGSLGLTLTGDIEDRIALSVFLARAQATAVVDELGWGGVEILVPIGIAGVDQAIVYRARYSALVDTGRFGSVAQQVFETLLTASVRF